MRLIFAPFGSGTFFLLASYAYTLRVVGIIIPSKRAKVVSIVKAGRAAHHLDLILVSAEQAVRSEVKDLLSRVTRDVIGEGDLRSSPQLVIP